MSTQAEKLTALKNRKSPVNPVGETPFERSGLTKKPETDEERKATEISEKTAPEKIEKQRTDYEKSEERYAKYNEEWKEANKASVDKTNAGLQATRDKEKQESALFDDERYRQDVPNNDKDTWLKRISEYNNSNDPSVQSIKIVQETNGQGEPLYHLNLFDIDEEKVLVTSDKIPKLESKKYQPFYRQQKQMNSETKFKNDEKAKAKDNMKGGVDPPLENVYYKGTNPLDISQYTFDKSYKEKNQEIFNTPLLEKTQATNTNNQPLFIKKDDLYTTGDTDNEGRPNKPYFKYAENVLETNQYGIDISQFPDGNDYNIRDSKIWDIKYNRGDRFDDSIFSNEDDKNRIRRFSRTFDDFLDSAQKVLKQTDIFQQETVAFNEQVINLLKQLAAKFFLLQQIIETIEPNNAYKAYFFQLLEKVRGSFVNFMQYANDLQQDKYAQLNGKQQTVIVDLIVTFQKSIDEAVKTISEKYDSNTMREKKQEYDNISVNNVGITDQFSKDDEALLNTAKISNNQRYSPKDRINLSNDARSDARRKEMDNNYTTSSEQLPVPPPSPPINIVPSPPPPPPKEGPPVVVVNDNDTPSPPNIPQGDLIDLTDILRNSTPEVDAVDPGNFYATSNDGKTITFINSQNSSGPINVNLSFPSNKYNSEQVREALVEIKNLAIMNPSSNGTVINRIPGFNEKNIPDSFTDADGAKYDSKKLFVLLNNNANLDSEQLNTFVKKIPNRNSAKEKISDITSKFVHFLMNNPVAVKSPAPKTHFSSTRLGEAIIKLSSKFANNFGNNDDRINDYFKSPGNQLGGTRKRLKRRKHLITKKKQYSKKRGKKVVRKKRFSFQPLLMNNQAQMQQQQQQQQQQQEQRQTGGYKYHQKMSSTRRKPFILKSDVSKRKAVTKSQSKY